MKNIAKQIKNSKGYVTIEALTLTGVVLTLVVYGLTAFYASGEILTDSAIDKIDNSTTMLTTIGVTLP